MRVRAKRAVPTANFKRALAPVWQFGPSASYMSKPHVRDQPGHHRQFGSLQLLLGVKQGLTSSFPQIFLPARLGFLL